MRPETRYAQSGGLDIAYQVVGEGPLEILFVPGFASNLEIMWELPAFGRILQRLSSLGRLVTLDKRGMGLSDRSMGAGAPEDRMDDLRAVIEAAGLSRPAIVAISEGGPLSLLFATTYPDRAKALVLWGTFSRLSRAPDYPEGFEPEQMERFFERAAARWGTGLAFRTFISGGPEDEATTRSMGRYERLACTPGGVREILKCAVEMDVRAALPAVGIPALVIHRTGDPLVPVALARYVAERIESARLLELDGDWHLNAELGAEDDALDAIEEFLTGSPAGPVHDADRVLATVLFTDVVGSTRLAAEIGDRNWKARIEQHDRIAAAEVERHRGTLVRVTGDGLLATFDGPGRCIRAAEALIEAVRPLGLDLRAGVHTGEIDRLEHDIAGLAVHAGARIAALAGPGEVLVSSTVKDLVIGSGLEFADRGVHELNGVPGEWQLWQVAG